MKQKLIRLKTDDQNARFDNYINDDLILKKNSKVALLNVSAQRDYDTLSINGTNDKYGFNLNVIDNVDTNRQNVYLEHQEIELDDTTDVNDLLQKMTTSYNKQVLSNLSVANGKEWKIFVDNNKKINFSCKNGVPVGVANINDYNNQTENNIYVSNFETLQDGPINLLKLEDTTQPGLLIVNYPLSRGAGIFYKNISNLGPIDPDDPVYPPDITGSFITGLIGGDISVYKSQRSVPVEAIIIGLVYELGVYYKVLNGVATELTTYTPEQGDNFRVITEQGIMKSQIFNTNTVIDLDEQPYNHIDFVFGFFQLAGNEIQIDIRIGCGVSWTYSNIPPTLGANEELQNTISRNDAFRRIFFPNLQTANILGFKKNLIRSVNSYYIEIEGSDELVWLADNEINIYDPSDQYIVELQNINVECYDAVSSGRKNYLLPFTNQDNLGVRISYDTTFPIFINTKSVTDQVLRVIKARILDQLGGDIFVTGSSFITLLIQEEE